MADAASELEALAYRLRLVSDGGLLRELTKAMRDAVSPVQDQVRAGLKPHMPGRYAEVLDADLRLGSSVRTAGSDPGVSLTARSAGKKRKLRRLDSGLLTHPLFGNREHWYTQEEPSVRPGWFTGPARDAAPQVRAAIEKALDDVAARAAGRGA